MNFLAFGAKFISCWIRIRFRKADSYPGDKSNADPCGSGSETLSELLKELKRITTAHLAQLR
jgi:hypothetical protein